MRFQLQRRCSRIRTKARRFLTTTLCFLVIFSVIRGGSLAYALGGDVITPYPVQDTRPGKQEPKAVAFDSAGNALIGGYQNLSGSTDDDYWLVKLRPDGTIAWRAAFNKAGGSDLITAVAVDGNDNVVVTGVVWNGINTDIHTIKYNGATGAVIWQHTYNGTANGNDMASGIAVDAGNDVYVSGYTQSSGGSDDGLLLKFNGAASGASNPPVATASYNGPANGADRFKQLAVRGSAVAVTGESWNGTDFDIVTSRYDLSLNSQWTVGYSSSGANHDSGKYVRIDAAGSVIIAGVSANGLDYDDYVAKYAAADGSRLWDVLYNGGYDEEPNALVVDSVGDVYIAGYTWTLSGRNDFFTARYNGTTGMPIWQRVYNSGTNNDDVATATGLLVDEAGDVFVTGYTVAGGNFDYRSVKYNRANGNLLWQKGLNGPQGKNDRPVGIGLTPASELLIVGWTDSTRPLDGGATSATSGTQSTLENSARSWSDDQWSGYSVMITSGPNAGTSSVVTGNTATTLTVSPPFAQAITTGTGYYIYFPNDYDIYAVKYDKGLLNPPTDLTAAAVSNSSIQLTWQDNASNEELFRIERKLGEAGTFSEIATVTATTTTYLDTDLQANNYYYYRVRAYSAALQNSAYSNEAHALTTVIAYQSPVWSFIYNDPANNEDYTTAIATGPDNNPVVTGYSIGAVTGYDYLTFKLDSTTGTPAWSDRYDASFDEIDQARTIVVDSANAPIVSGFSSRYNGVDRNTNSIYTIKYPPTGPTIPGTGLWADQYNGPGRIDDRATAITSAIDGSNSVVVVGYGKNTANNDDIYVVKYNQDGTRAWAAQPYDGGGNDYPSAVAIDKDGNVFIAAYSHNGSNYDYFTAKYCGGATAPCSGKNPGEIIWSDMFNGAGNGTDQARSIAIDNNGNAYVTGSAVNGAGVEEFYTIKYDGANSSSRRRIWERSYHGPAAGNDYAVAVRLDPIAGYSPLDGNIIVAGASSTNIGDHDFHLLRYSSDGDLVWQRTLLRQDSDDLPVDMAIDASGNLYLAGTASDGLTTDILSAIHDFEGTFLGALTYNGAANGFDEASAVTVNRRGEAFIAGYSTNAAGNGDYLVLKQKNNYLLVPAPFTGSAPADSSRLDLSWQGNTPGTSFRLERTDGPISQLSSWAAIASLPVGSISYQDTGLAPGKEYCYRIDAVSGSLNSRKLSACLTTSLSAPTQAAVQAVSVSRLDLTWTNVAGNTGYKVERKIGAGGSWSDLAMIGPDVTFYSDTGLAAGQAYFYRVRARNVAGYSLPGSEVSALTLPDAPLLNAPTGVTTSTASLAWGNVAGESGYKVERKQGAAGTWGQIGTTGADVTTYDDSGLAGNTLYYYRVRATNASGDSAYSNEQSTTTLFAAPTLTSIAAVSQGQIDLAWTDVIDETSYKVEESACAPPSNPAYNCVNYPWVWTAWAQVATPGANVTTLQRTGINPNTHYKYRVTALTTGNSSAPSNELMAETWLTPSTVSIAPGTATSLYVSWTENRGATRYDLERKQGAGGSWQAIATGLLYNVLTRHDTNLAERTEYCYRIKSYSDLVTAPPYVYGSETCMSTPLPAPVLNPLTVVSGSRLDLSWGNVTGNTGYEVERARFNYPDNPEWAANNNYYEAWAKIATLGTDQATHQDSTLAPGETYKYRVRDLFAGGYSSYSNEVIATTQLPIPVMTTAVTVSASQLNVNWNNVYGESSYLLEWKLGSGGTWSAPISVPQNAVSYNHTGLTAGATYYYRIRAANSAYTSGYSNEISKTTLLDPPVLNQPTSVTVSSLALSWNNIADNNGYKVERKTGSNGTWGQVGTTGINVTTFNDSGLSPGSQYYYRVTVQNGSGYSLPSNEMGAVTTPPATTASLSTLSSADVEISWPVVIGATDYKVEQKTGTGGTWGEIGSVTAAYGTSYCGSAYPTVNCPSATTTVARFSAHGLTNDTTYCYQVKAWNSTGGDSAPSSQVCMKTMSNSEPTLTAIPLTPYKVRLDWVPGNESAAPDGYLIEEKLATGTFARIAKVPGAVTTYTVSRCQPNSSHTYRIRPYRGVIEGFDTGIDSAVWVQRATVYTSTNAVAADLYTPPVTIIDPVNGSAWIKGKDGAVELYTTSPGDGLANSYNFLRFRLQPTVIPPNEFDMTVAFTLPNGVVNLGQYHVLARLQFNVPGASGGTDLITVERYQGGYSTNFVINGVNHGTAVASTDVSGTLRLTRRNNTLSSYYLTPSGWQLLQSVSYANTYEANWFGVLQYAQRNEVVQLRILLDNFEVVDYPSSYSNEVGVKTPSFTQGATSCD
jgi:uncharacterized delta-60 repeat protein